MTEKKHEAKKTDPSIEIRLSILEKDADGTHTKHCAGIITEPALCEAILDSISEHVDIDEFDDAHSFQIPEPKAEKKSA